MKAPWHWKEPWFTLSALVFGFCTGSVLIFTALLIGSAIGGN